MNFLCRQTQALSEAIRNYSELRMRYRNGVLRDPASLAPTTPTEIIQKPTSGPTKH